MINIYIDNIECKLRKKQNLPKLNQGTSKIKHANTNLKYFKS